MDAKKAKSSLFNNKRKKNEHRLNEVPKNRASKLVANHRFADVEWLSRPGSFRGHKPRRGGHRRVSGLVRASLKEELRKKSRKSYDNFII